MFLHIQMCLHFNVFKSMVKLLSYKNEYFHIVLRKYLWLINNYNVSSHIVRYSCIYKNIIVCFLSQMSTYEWFIADRLHLANWQPHKMRTVNFNVIVLWNLGYLFFSFLLINVWDRSGRQEISLNIYIYTQYTAFMLIGFCCWKQSSLK